MGKQRGRISPPPKLCILHYCVQYASFISSYSFLSSPLLLSTALIGKGSFLHYGRFTRNIKVQNSNFPLCPNTLLDCGKLMWQLEWGQYLQETDGA